jgi:hypothetical protein
MLKHACRLTCSGWQNGYYEGRKISEAEITLKNKTIEDLKATVKRAKEILRVHEDNYAVKELTEMERGL